MEELDYCLGGNHYVIQYSNIVISDGERACSCLISTERERGEESRQEWNPRR